MADRFTSEQRAAIDSVGRTIVSASAGSGKTTVMIEKIINLICDGCKVNEILAVTFTKKAASQMKEKLSKALIKAINAPETTDEKRKELKKQLSEVPSADISTIHSFCSKLIRSHFYAAGVDNGFRVIGGEDAEGTELKNAALDELLDEGYETHDAGFLHLLSVYWRKKSDNTLRKIFLQAYETLRSRADYREYLARSCGYNEDTFRAVCTDLLHTLREKCDYYLNFAEDERIYFEGEGSAAPLALATELIEALETIAACKDYFEACALEKPKFTIIRKGKKDAAEKRLHMERLSELKGKISKIFDDELSETRSYEEELSAFLCAGKTAAALAEQLLKFDEKYEALKREKGVLDYNDLEHIAYRLLESEDTAEELRNQYRYVFVDEYQDVNPVQEAIVSRIGGKNLFLVGDVKQSIYGFRGSKSKFFVEKQKEFETTGANLKMTRNFRSSDLVLDAVNTQFSLAMTPATSSVDYARDSYMEKGGRYRTNDGRVQLHLVGEEEKKELGRRGVYSVKESTGFAEEEASMTAKTIRHIIEQELSSKWYDPDEGVGKRVTYSDIAILSRKKGGQIAKTVAALAAEGIPITAASAVNICEFSEIKTLIDILSLIDNAEQDVALCSALLSPMGGLTADELTNIRLEYREERFFRKAAKKYAETQHTVTAQKLKRFYAYFSECRKLACVIDAGELLTKIITDTRMEAALLSKANGEACLRRVHRFIEEAVSADVPLYVHAFLERLRALNYKIECSENGGEDSVKVLTMHSSKGLEYPVVIIDDLNAPFRGSDKNDVLVEEKYGLAPKAFDEARMLKTDTLLRRLFDKRETESSVADELNLYYVALTRAKYALHLLYKKPSAFADVRYAKSFADFTDFSVWEQYAVQDDIFDVPKAERMALVFHPDESLAQEIMRAFTAKYVPTGYENLPVKSSATALMDGQVAETFERVESGKTSVEEGVAYHAFLEKFDFSALYEDGALLPTIEATLSGMPSEYKGRLSLEKLVEILSNPVFLQLRDMRLYKEQQFLVSLPIKDTYALKSDVSEVLRAKDDGESMIFQGAIDLLGVGEDEVRIIDYKYSVHDKQTLKEKYAPQLRLYRMATAKILNVPIEKVRCTIVNIYRGFQVEME